MSTTQKKHKRAKYPSDLSKNQWKRLKKLLPTHQQKSTGVGRPPVELREVINAIFYVVKTGCSWRSLPHDFPLWPTVYGYFNRWSRDGTWQRIHTEVIKKVRNKMKRNKRPSAASLDSQSIKTTACGGEHRGYDGGKHVKGHRGAGANVSFSPIRRDCYWSYGYVRQGFPKKLAPCRYFVIPNK